MTNDEWLQAENTLLCWNVCNLKVDGYDVRLTLVPQSATKNVIYLSINQESSVKFCMEDCEERRRFCQKHKCSLLDADERKKLKREKKAVREEIEKMTTYYTYYPWWTSFRSMKSHFIKNNKEIIYIQN